MLLGIGTDILNIERIRNGLEGDSKAFIQQTFTVKEQVEASNQSDPASYYATRFAGKEAVFKCLGVDGNDIRLTEIEILGAEVEQPRVTLFGTVKDICAKKSVKDVRISLSYETDYAVAFAMVQD